MNNAQVYVVTRNGRRIEDVNYPSKENAEARAEELKRCLKRWNDPDLQKVSIVRTEKPNRIR